MTRLFLFLLFPLPLLAGWGQWMGDARDGVWREAGAERSDPAAAEQKWEVKCGGGYAGPAVSGGRVFLLSWYREPEQKDTSGGLRGEEELLCLDAKDGREIWRHRWAESYTIDYHDGPRATPTVHEGRVYALGAEGRLVCLDAASGKLQWQQEMKPLLKTKAPTWGFAGHPLIWEDLLICLGGGDSGTCVAFDRVSGKEKWRALSSRQAGYCPPVLIQHEGKPQIILWHGEAINALDPRTGSVLWTVPRMTQFGVSMAAPVYHGGQLLVSGFWWGSKMLKLPSGTGEPEVLWETKRESDTRTEHLNALMCSPLLVDGFLYGVCSYGQLRCLDWRSGARKWETFDATTGKETRWGNAFLTRLGDSSDFLLFNEKGELIRATLTPEGYSEQSRHKIIEPNCPDVRERPVVWSHPAYSGGCVFARNSTGLRCWRIVKE